LKQSLRKGVAMNHAEWVRKEFRAMAEHLGFRFTSQEEIESRLTKIRALMRKSAMGGLLVLKKMNYFYLTGTTQDGLLYVPSDGKPLLMIRRELERARVESPLDMIEALHSESTLYSLIKKHYGDFPDTVGLELDALPVRDFQKYRNDCPRVNFIDASRIFREARKIKSPFEIELMRTAGQIGKEVYEEARVVLKEGMTEIELGGMLDAAAKRRGHEGLLRVRSFNYEAYSWHILSGETGGIVSQSDSPMGGLGLSPAFPVGASRKVMRAHEPILIDYGICYHGYQADQTRMYSIGRMPQKFIDAYRACKEIHDAILEDVRPGADPEALFLKTLSLAEKLGYKDSYLGPPGLQTRFIGHGIGLELNELPFLAEGHSYPLEEGMVFAMEPKIVFSGEGAVGLENTVLVTSNGYEILTPVGQEIIEV
jgi:Xaa-Pro aminopeptidase